MNLKLGLQNTTIFIDGVLTEDNNGKYGTLNIKIHDYYDFNWQKNYNNPIITTINNIADIFEGGGAINGYNIDIYFKYYFDNRKET